MRVDVRSRCRHVTSRCAFVVGVCCGGRSWTKGPNTFTFDSNIYGQVCRTIVMCLVYPFDLLERVSARSGTGRLFWSLELLSAYDRIKLEYCNSRCVLTGLRVRFDTRGLAFMYSIVHVQVSCNLAFNLGFARKVVCFCHSLRPPVSCFYGRFPRYLEDQERIEALMHRCEFGIFSFLLGLYLKLYLLF